MKKIYTLFCFSILIGLKAQTLYPNFGFELGNLSNWNFFTAQRNLTSHTLTSIASCSVPCGATLIDTATVKTTACSITAVSPNPGRYIMMLTNAGSAYIASYQFTVNALAPVLNLSYVQSLTTGATETWTTQPFNQIVIKDASNNIIPGSFEDFTIITHSNTAVFGNPYYYCLGWATYQRNLTSYIGSVLKIEIANSGCAYSGHGAPVFIDGYFSTITGIAESELNKDIKIFPNPAKDYINIKTELTEEFAIQIYDLQGRLMKTENENKINVSELQPGLYLLRFISDLKTYTQTFVKE